MTSFKDKTGAAWDVEITFRLLAAIKARCGVCLLDLTEEDRKAKRAEADLQRLNSDFALFMNVLFVLCEAQASKRGLTDEQFGELFDWGCYTEAVAAVDEEFTLFCLPSSKKDKGRKVLRERAKLMDEVTDKALSKAEKAMNAGNGSAGSTLPLNSADTSG
jgi:hypothetical protein